MSIFFYVFNFSAPKKLANFVGLELNLSVVEKSVSFVPVSLLKVIQMISTYTDCIVMDGHPVPFKQKLCEFTELLLLSAVFTLFHFALANFCAYNMCVLIYPMVSNHEPLNLEN